MITRLRPGRVLLHSTGWEASRQEDFQQAFPCLPRNTKPCSQLRQDFQKCTFKNVQGLRPLFKAWQAMRFSGSLEPLLRRLAPLDETDLSAGPLEQDLDIVPPSDTMSESCPSHSDSDMDPALGLSRAALLRVAGRSCESEPPNEPSRIGMSRHGHSRWEKDETKAVDSRL